MEAPVSSFSGHVYGNGSDSTSGSNTQTHYKADNGKKKKPKKKRKIKGAAITKKDPSDGYSTTSVFANK